MKHTRQGYKILFSKHLRRH